MTDSQSVQKSLSACIDADGSSVNASLASTLSGAQSSANVACSCHQSARGSSDPLPALTFSPSTDITTLTTYAAGFDEASVNAPVVLCHTTAGYETLLPAATSFQSVITNRNTFRTKVAPVRSQLQMIWGREEFSTWQKPAKPMVALMLLTLVFQRYPARTVAMWRQPSMA